MRDWAGSRPSVSHEASSPWAPPQVIAKAAGGDPAAADVRNILERTVYSAQVRKSNPMGNDNRCAGPQWLAWGRL